MGTGTPSANRPDPIQLLIESDAGRIPALLPIRYGRMRQSPFAFLRGAAAVMAFDLAHTPTHRLARTGVRRLPHHEFRRVRVARAQPDFRYQRFRRDAAGALGMGPQALDREYRSRGSLARARDRGNREDAVRAAVHSYREHLAEYATMPSLEVWYQRIDFEELIERVPGPKNRKRDRRAAERARRETVPITLLPSTAGENTKIKDHPPLHLSSAASTHSCISAASRDHASSAIATRSHTSYRVLFDRFELLDVALKVVGIGSVGTFCEVALFRDAQAAPLFLQIKEARASVLEPYAGRSLSVHAWTASRQWPAPDASRQRHIPGMDGRATAAAGNFTCANCAT